MTETPGPEPSSDPQNQPVLKKTARAVAVEKGKQAAAMADKASTFAEKTSGFFSAVKWLSIAIVMLVIFSGGYAVYKALTVPAKAVGNAVGEVSGAVKAGSDKVRESGTEVLERLTIPITQRRQFEKAAEAAFSSLTRMEPTKPDGMKDRMYRASQFAGHEDRLCRFDLTVGDNVLPVAMAADNKAYATAKALGSKNDRLIRLIVQAGEDDIALRTLWDPDTSQWILKWKSTTLKKPIEDNVAEQRVLEILQSAAKVCR